MKHLWIWLGLVALLTPCLAEESKWSRHSMEQLLKDTVVKDFLVEDLTMEEALGVIEEHLKAETGIVDFPMRYLDREGVNKLLGKPAPKVKDKPGKVTIKLTNASLEEALRYCTDLARCTYRFVEGEIIVAPQSLIPIPEAYRLAVFPLGTDQVQRLEESGATVFEEGSNCSTGVTLVDLFKVSDAELGLRTTNPFEDVGIRAAPGAFYALLKNEYAPDSLVVYDQVTSVELLEFYLESCGFLHHLQENYFGSHADHYESLKGWDRVETLLEISEWHPAAPLQRPTEIMDLVTLAQTLEQLTNRPDTLDIAPADIPAREKAIRQKMLELSDRYIATLRVQQEVADLVPESRSIPQESVPDDPFQGLNETPPVGF